MTSATEIRPVYIFSMPRAGSTLLQRILAGHERISSTAEPWIMLPLLYALRREGIYAEYAHISATTGIEGFLSSFPRGSADFRAELREFALRLYARASDGEARYFLDKTPRYHLIADELIDLFPDGKHIFLWRNPLAIAASMMETWAKGRWNLYRFKVDLYDGPGNLVEAFRAHRDRVHAVRFEDLVARPRHVVERILSYLDLEMDDSLLERFAETGLVGRMGDPTGTRQYDEISAAPLSKWKRLFANPVRKAWAARYLRRIGGPQLAVMGYDLEQLLAELAEVPTRAKYLGSDVLRWAYGSVYLWAEPRQLVRKVARLGRRKALRVHT